MEFLKKNYEKVLLGVVLLGLTVAVGSLPVLINIERSRLEEQRTSVVKTKPKPLEPVPMALEDTAIQRAESVYALNFTHNHNLFNPVLWQKTAEGRPVKVEAGREPADSVQVLDIKPLYLRLTFNSVSGSSYLVGVQNEAASLPSKRNGEKLVSRDSKNEIFSLQDIKGPPEKPLELILNLNETGEAISISPDKPFKRVAGYAADLKYAADNNKMWRGQRIGAPLVFAGGMYNIVGITQTNVVLKNQQNDKKTTIPFNPANAVTETR